MVNPFSSLTHMCVYEYVKLFYKPWASDIGCNIDKLSVLFWKGRGLVTPSKLLANHSALGQLTNHNTFSFSERRAFIKPGTN